MKMGIANRGFMEYEGPRMWNVSQMWRIISIRQADGRPSEWQKTCEGTKLKMAAQVCANMYLQEEKQGHELGSRTTLGRF